MSIFENQMAKTCCLAASEEFLKTTVPTISTVIFDCGRVITLDQDPKHARAMADFFKPSSDLSEFIEIYTLERPAYDQGFIDALTYWNNVGRHYGMSVSVPDVSRLITLDMRSWFSINAETVAIIQELKRRNFRLMILSNMNEEGKAEMFGASRYCGEIDWIRLFDDILLSCDLFQLKPQQEIYKTCIARAGTQADACLFIDDSPTNIQAARECGLHGIVFSHPSQLREALRNEYRLLG